MASNRCFSAFLDRKTSSGLVFFVIKLPAPMMFDFSTVTLFTIVQPTPIKDRSFMTASPESTVLEAIQQ